MRLPDKVTPYKKSILAKFPIVLKVLKEENMTVEKLYNKIKRQIGNLVEFNDILICLYALKKIDFIDDEVLYYAEDDTM